MAKKEYSAKRVPGGVENKLAGWGVFFMVIGVIGLLVGIFMLLSEQPIGLVIGFGLFLQGMLIRVLFDGGAEVIRLLKSSNGLPYNGSISGVMYVYKCSNCGTQAWADDKICRKCGEDLI